MLMSHIVLISTNQTTVEHVAARAMKDRESETLNTMHSFWGCMCVLSLFLNYRGAKIIACAERNAARGRHGMPSGAASGARATCGGSVTYARTGSKYLDPGRGRGSVRLSFSMSPVLPLTRSHTVPIGSTKDLGLAYPRNPRFDDDGRWMPRKEWPTELQLRA
jgi:palmitoyltransferase